jgi:long-chain acyl-CoA synthetase
MTLDQTTAAAPAAKAPRRSTEATTLGEMFLRSAELFSGPALRWKEGDRWVDMRYPELGRHAREIARGLIALGIERGDRVAILSDTRPEWTLADAGAMCAGAATAPIYQTNSPGECRYVLEHSDARVVFCEDADQLAKVAQVRDDCPALEHVVMLTGEGEGALSMDALRARGYEVPEREVDARAAAVHPEDMASLVYTSGTTGPPKGCVLTHSNWISTMRMYEGQLGLEDHMLIYIFLPLAHSLARTTQMVALDVGGTLAFWQRDAKRVLDDLREVRPTHVPSVPRVFEKIFTAAQAGIAEQPRVKQLVFNWALSTGRRVRRHERSGSSPGRLLQAQQDLADRLALSKVRDLFGGRLSMALTGAAPIGREVLEFFDACGVTVLEGYGMSESTAAGTLNTPKRRRIGTVGRALPGTEVRIAGDGEVLMRGPHVFSGYYKDPAATEEALEPDGWLRTGDLGALDDGYLSITGRKKDIIITSSGKNITPVNIENALKENRWISEAVVYGDAHPYLVALIALDPEELPALAAKLGVDADIEAMASDDRVRSEIQGVVDATNERFARIEQVKRFLVLDRDLSQATGEMTPTMKVKRAVVYERYHDELEGLYA